MRKRRMMQGGNPAMMPQDVMQLIVDEEAPARVRLAFEFVRYAGFKKAPHCAVNPMSIEWKEGTNLEACEKDTLIQACETLGDYFSGKLKKDAYEKGKKDQSMMLNGQPGFMMHCPNCFPNTPQPTCTICRGEGGGLFFPMKKDEE